MITQPCNNNVITSNSNVVGCIHNNLPEIADYIDTQDALNKLCAQLLHSDFIAVDTEFVREKTYLPQLCLIQIATNSTLAIIDPLVLLNLVPLWEIFQNPTITKVLHSGRQDLEIFHEQCGKVIAPLFDTQLAATLLNYGDQIGYGNLVAAECGIHLDKAHTRTDWTARPLGTGQLRYAADDVRYLALIYDRIKTQLEQNGRLSWLLEDFAALANPAGYGTLPADAWERVRGIHTLQDHHLGPLQRLAAWREQQARTENRPRRWVISDEVLLELARHPPHNLEKLGGVPGLDAGAAHRYGHQLLMLLQTVTATPVSTSKAPRRFTLTSTQEALVDCLVAVVRLQCITHHVSFASLTSRRDLEALVLGEGDLPLFHGWRRVLAGQAVLDMLHGGNKKSMGSDSNGTNFSFNRLIIIN